MPPLQRGPCRVAVLVDTSKSMASRWPELAHQYIPALLDALPNAKEDGSDVSVSIVPIRDGVEQFPSFMRFLDKRTQIQNLHNAGFGPEVSENAIWRGFERGINSLCQPGDTSMKYLIVSLTSFPGSAMEAGSSSAPYAPWEGFVQKMVKFDIRMTMIMEPVRSYKSVNDFFKSVLTQQRRQFTSPWFAYNARLHHFLISGFSKRSIIRERSKGGTTGSAMPAMASNKMGHQVLPAGAFPDIPDIQIGIGKIPVKLGLVEELRRRTGFWPAGADLPGPSSKSRSSRGVSSQQKRIRVRERGESGSPESVEAPSPLQEFPAFLPPGPSSVMSSPNSDQAVYDWSRSQSAGSLPSLSSPLGHVPIPGPSMSSQPPSGYPGMHPPNFSSMYPTSGGSPSFPPPSNYPSTSYPQPSTSFQGAGSPMYFNPPGGIPGPPPSRSPYRPLSPHHGRPASPMHSSGPPGYRGMLPQDAYFHQHPDGGVRWLQGPIPPQYLSKHEDSSLYGGDGRR